MKCFTLSHWITKTYQSQNLSKAVNIPMTISPSLVVLFIFIFAIALLLHIFVSTFTFFTFLYNNFLFSVVKEDFSHVCISLLQYFFFFHHDSPYFRFHTSFQRVYFQFMCFSISTHFPFNHSYSSFVCLCFYYWTFCFNNYKLSAITWHKPLSRISLVLQFFFSSLSFFKMTPYTVDFLMNLFACCTLKLWHVSKSFIFILNTNTTQHFSSEFIMQFIILQFMYSLGFLQLL